MKNNRISRFKAAIDKTAIKGARYVDGPHRKSSHEFYATAPAYSKPYQNPWTARIVRSSRLSKEETASKPLRASIVDKIMAIAVMHRFSPSKQETQRPSALAGAAHETWFKWLTHVSVVGAGTLVGLGLRPIDKVRHYISRHKMNSSRLVRAHKDNTLALTILAVGAIGTIGIIGSYFVAGSGFVPVEPISVQPEPPQLHPITENEADDSQDDDARVNNEVKSASKEDANDCDCEGGTTSSPQQASMYSSSSDAQSDDSSTSTETTGTSTTNNDTSTSSDTQSSTTDESNTQNSTTDESDTTNNPESDQEEESLLNCTLEGTEDALSDPLNSLTSPSETNCL